MKKFTIFAVLATALLMTMSSCSGSDAGSDKSLLFGSLPSEYAEFKSKRDKLNEEAKDIKTEEEKAELIKKGKKLDEKWTPKLEEVAKGLDGREINITDSIFKVTAPISLTFEKLKGSTLEPIFKINGSAETTEPIMIENTFNPSRLVYIAGYGADGNELFKSQVGRISGNVSGNKLEIPAGTSIEFTTLKFDSAYVDKYIETKTIKFIYL